MNKKWMQSIIILNSHQPEYLSVFYITMNTGQVAPFQHTVIPGLVPGFLILTVRQLRHIITVTTKVPPVSVSSTAKG